MTIRALLTSLFFILFCLTASTQKTISESVESAENTLLRLVDKREVVTDTIFPDVFSESCAENVFNLFINQTWGNVGGTNGFMDLQKAQRFDYDGTNITLSSAAVFFARADVVGDGNVRVNIFATDGENGGPGTLLGTSEDIPVSELNVPEQGLGVTQFNFTKTIGIPENSFFVSVDFTDLYTSNDTVAIWTSDVDCGDGDDTWELLGDNQTWIPFTDENQGWNIESNLLIGVIIDADQSTSVIDTDNPSLQLYPNPARNQLNLKGSTDPVQVVNLQGVVMYQSNGSVSEIDISQWPEGIYVIRSIGLEKAGARLFVKQ